MYRDHIEDYFFILLLSNLMVEIDVEYFMLNLLTEAPSFNYY